MRFRHAVYMLCVLMSASIVAADTPWIDCPATIAGTCRATNNGCMVSKDYGGATICRRCASGTRRNMAGQCVQCNIQGCNSCSSTNTCEACSNNLVLANNECTRQTCPVGCQSCDDGKCYPCGRVFHPTAAHTLASVSFRCATSPDDIKEANPTLKAALDKLDPADSLAGINKLKMPPATVGGPGQQPSAPVCSNGQVWLTCAGTTRCPAVVQPDGSTKLYGCVNEQVCIDLYGSCIAEANGTCPNCCFSRNCLNGNVPETWYILTFANSGGAAACDPWGWWRG